MAKRILIVDEAEEATKLYKKALEGAGFEVKVVKDAPSAKAALESEHFDGALIDIRLPGTMSGFELLGQIRANEKTQGLPVIILSGFADQEELRTKCTALGAECVAKGNISLAELAEKVKHSVNL